MECRHLDGDPTNNTVDNLCWGTRLENQRDRIEHGTSSRGEQNPKAKLNNLQVRVIRHLLSYKKEFTQIEIAAIFNISPSVVCDIKKGNTWKHLTKK